MFYNMRLEYLTIPPSGLVFAMRKNDAQNGSTMSGFGRDLLDFFPPMETEMPAEEAIPILNLN